MIEETETEYIYITILNTSSWVWKYFKACKKKE